MMVDTGAHFFVVDPSEVARDLMSVALRGRHWKPLDTVDDFALQVDRGLVPAVAMIGPDVTHSEVLRLASSIRRHQAPAALLYVADAATADQTQRALDAGVHAVLDRDALSQDLQSAVDEAIEKASDMRPAVGDVGPSTGAAIVTVFGTKGGVGASLVAANLAGAFVQQGASTVLLDLAPEAPSLDVMFQTPPLRTVQDALDRLAALDPGTAFEFTTPVTDKLRLLSPSEGGTGGDLPVSDVLDLVRLLSEGCRVLVCDVGRDRELLAELAEVSHRVVAVTSLDLSSLRAARGLLAELHDDSGRRVFVTNDPSSASSGLSQGHIHEVAEAHPDYAIPFDRFGPKSLNDGMPLVFRRRSKAGQVVTQMAERFSSDLNILRSEA